MRISEDWEDLFFRKFRPIFIELKHSDLNDQNLFHSTIDVRQRVPGKSNLDDQTEVHSAELDR